MLYSHFSLQFFSFYSLILLIPLLLKKPYSPSAFLSEMSASFNSISASVL